MKYLNLIAFGFVGILIQLGTAQAADLSQSGPLSQSIFCYSRGYKNTNIQIGVNLATASVKKDVVILHLESKPIYLKKNFSYFVGQPGTRLSGITQYYFDLFHEGQDDDAADLYIYMNSHWLPDELPTPAPAMEGGATLTYHGEEIHFSCLGM